MVRCERLHLIPCDEALLRAIVAGPPATAKQLDARVPANWPEFPDAYARALENVARDSDSIRWRTYVFVDPTLGALVGSGGFAGPPSPDGVVELGYETAPEFRGRGYGTEAARGLAAFAFGHPEVTAVDAHTLPDRNPSTRILERCGLRFVGVVEDPTDGTIWHWRVTRAEWMTASCHQS